MIFTRKLPVKNIVLGKDELKRLADLLFKEHKEMKDSHFKIVAHYKNNSSYKGDDLSLFNDGGQLDLKVVNSIKISFSDYNSNNSIDVSLRQDYDFNNEIDIAGGSEMWVNNQYVCLERLLNSFTPQGNLLIRNKIVFVNFIALTLAFTLVLSIRFLLSLFYPEMLVEDSTDPAPNPLLLWLFAWVLTIFPAIILELFVSKLWPSVEFDFGPDHLKTYKFFRKILVAIFTFGFLGVAGQILEGLVLMIR